VWGSLRQHLDDFVTALCSDSGLCTTVLLRRGQPVDVLPQSSKGVGVVSVSTAVEGMLEVLSSPRAGGGGAGGGGGAAWDASPMGARFHAGSPLFASPRRSISRSFFAT
jgi:hypothetical protein